MQTNRINRNLLTACFIILMMYFFLYSVFDQPILSNNVYDSYTIQAVRWWQGELALDRDYSWLELAYYDNQIYVSFPPFPSVPMFLLVPFFGSNTPSNLMTTLYALASFILVFYYCKRKGSRDLESLFWASFVVLGVTFCLFLVLRRNCTQVLSFLLSLLSIYLITSKKRSIGICPIMGFCC